MDNLENTNVDEKQEQEQVDEKVTLTQKELEAKLQSETDRKVSKALETAKAKWEEEFRQKLEAEKAEAEKLAKMSAEQREKAKFDKEREEFLKLKAEFEKKQLVAETATQLAEEGLPAQFAKLLAGQTAEETKQNLDAFKAEWQKALEAEVNKKLGQGVVPKARSEVTGITKEQFEKMTYSERVKLFSDNPTLFNQLSQ